MDGAKTTLAALPARILAARPSLRAALAGTVLWAACTGGNAAGALWLGGWQNGAAIARVGLLFAAGGMLAFVPGLWAGRVLGGTARPERIAAAVFLCLCCATVAAIGALFALEYRAYYARWHGAPFSRLWLYAFFFTGLSGLYQFATFGLRLLFPFGFFALLAAAFLAARRPR